MVEEQDVEYKSKNARYTIRMCIMTDRMITMITVGQTYDEILEYFLNQNFEQDQVIRTWNLIINAAYLISGKVLVKRNES